MSALAILSAPAAPPPLQGAAVDASLPGSGGVSAGLFGGLLTAVLGDTGADEATAQPDDAPDGAAEAASAAASLQPASLPAAPLVLAIEPPPPPSGDAAASPQMLTGAPEMPPSAAGAAESSAAAPSPAPIPAPSIGSPNALPAMAKPSKDSQPLIPLPAGLVEDTASVAAAQPAPETNAVAPSPNPTPIPVPTPMPLRPLAERTTQASEAEPTKAGAETATPSDSTNQAGDSRPQAEPGIKTADPPAGAVARDASPSRNHGEPSAAPAEPAPGAAAGPGRDLGVTTNLSRATIDATAQIAARIVRQLEGRSTRFEMALLPEELGRVDVKLDIDSEGRLAARLAFDNPAAATDLRGRADELRRQLEQQGFHVADDAFEFTQRDSGSHAFDRGQEQSGGRSRAFSSAARLNAEAELVPARWTPLSLSPSGVDMKV